MVPGSGGTPPVGEGSGAAPLRVAVLTASIGEGHNSAARAVSGWLTRSPRRASVRVLDVFAPAAGGRGAVLRRLYRSSVQYFPAGYQLWYWAIASVSWCHRYYQCVQGARVGRMLRRELAAFAPDVVVSTYPLATAGAAWLRRRGELSAPLRALLTDFAPHRFWVYPGVDAYLVLTDAGRVALRVLTLQVPVHVCALPVDGHFEVASRSCELTGRARFGLPVDRLTVLVSGGSMAMGSIRRAVRAVRAAGAHAVVLCGVNEPLLRALQRAEHRGLLTAMPWTDDMPALMSACDVVVDNAGGAVAAEALATGRALVVFRPITGHGRASARLLADAGLARTVYNSHHLTDLLRQWGDRPEALRRVHAQAVRFAEAHSPTDSAQTLLSPIRAETGSW